MQPSPSGILRGHWSTEERTLKLWLTLELRLLVEGEQNVESLMSCNMGSSTLWTKESLAGRQAWRKLSSQSVCTHKHGSHLTLCAHFWLSPCRIPGTNLWSWMPTCEPLTCSHVAIDVWQTMFHFCLPFPFEKGLSLEAPVWPQALRGRGMAQDSRSPTEHRAAEWELPEATENGEFCGCGTI